MTRSKLSKALALFLAFLTLCGNFSVTISISAAEDTSGGRTMAEWNEILNTSEYEEYLKEYADVPRGEKLAPFDAAAALDPACLKEGVVEKVTTIANDVTYEGEEMVYTSKEAKAVWNVTVPKEGLYTITFHCFPGDAKLEEGDTEKSTDVERILYVNGKVPYSEARSITITKRWSAQTEDGNHGFSKGASFKKDIAGNDIRPDNVSAIKWIDYTVKDATGFYAEPLEFYFKEGVNTIALESTREPMVIKSITLAPKVDLPTYKEYKASYPNTKGKDVIKLEAELPTYQSDESIYPLTDRTSAVTSPQDPKLQLLNFMGGTENFKTVGQWVEYEFEVKTEGFYSIAIRSKQNDLSGMFTSRTVYIDEKIPFAECTNIRFDYTKDWVCEKIGDGTTEFEFYLKPGKHSLRIEVSLGQFADIIRRVETSLNNINSCYLDIMKLTGADPDEYRDYGFSRLMPNTIQIMVKESRELYAVSDEITKLCGEKGSQTATLDKVAFLLEKMGTNEDEIASNLDNLKTYIGTLGTWLNGVRSQPVRMDYIMIQPATQELPKANASFWDALVFEFQAFFASFFTDYSTMGATTNDAAKVSIEVWTTEGRDQAKILKNLVSSDFTTETGIGVNVKLVAAGTLLPSVLSGQGPDSFLGAAGVDVVNYAIRNAVVPLNDFEGFDEFIMDNYNPDSVAPVTLYGTTYGLPERAGFYMMFVRMDILADLGLEVPETWDDVLSMLPVLQANNMTIGLNKEYDIFLYQMGGDRFDKSGMRCDLDSNVALDAFETYTRFFTDYSFPFTFDGPNRFRTGEMPILIADYSTTYNQLTVFATEIDGLWQMRRLPGIYRDADGDGVEELHNEAFNLVAATIMLHGTSDQKSTWEFMKWYCGHEAQAAYGSDLVTTIGQAAKYNTANRKAIAEMPWTTSEYTELSYQFKNLSSFTNYPGAYIFARYLNFALLSVVNEGQDPVVELQGYVSTINKEITRKRQEFDLPVLPNGKKLEDEDMADLREEWDTWLKENSRQQEWNDRLVIWEARLAEEN